MNDKKRCHGCNKEKGRTEFALRSDRPIGLQSRCRKCQATYTKDRRKRMPHVFKDYDRRGHLKQTYGITVNDYNVIFEKQGGKCLGCGRYQHELKRALDVDHCHKSGKIRGLLCFNCNRALGYAKDSVEILNNLASYLRN